MQSLGAISKMTERSLFPRQLIQYTLLKSMPQPLIPKELKLYGSVKTSKSLQNYKDQTNKNVLFIIGDKNAKIGSQEIPGVTGKFGLRVQNEAGQRLIEFCQENALVIANAILPTTQEMTTHGHHWMVNTEIRLIICFATEDGGLYSQKKQDQELTLPQIMTPYCKIQT